MLHMLRNVMLRYVIFSYVTYFMLRYVTLCYVMLCFATGMSAVDRINGAQPILCRPRINTVSPAYQYCVARVSIL